MHGSFGRTERTRWWTFAGLLANATIADHLRAAGVAVGGRDDLGITLGMPPGSEELRPALVALRAEPASALRPLTVPEGAAQALKFHFCVPPRLLAETLRARLADPAAAAETLELPVVEVSPGGG